MHDGDSLDCGKYVSDVFDTNTRIWRHCDDANFTEISYFLEEIYNREVHQKKGKLISGTKDIFFVVYIRTNHLIASSSVVLKYVNVFKKYFRVRQYIGDKVKTGISLIKDELQHFFEKFRSCIKN